jgi:Flp pilus assembly secretin CpaC/tetratricopeptide (TPR) repeat protein
MAFPVHLRATRNGPRLGAWLLCCFALTNSASKTWAQTPATQGAAVQDRAQQGQAQQGTAGQEQTQQSPPAQSQPEAGQAEPAQAAPAQPSDGAGTGTALAAAGSHPVETAPSKRHLRQAEDAYLAGANKLQRDDLIGAEREFTRAQKLDPGNRDYAIAISLARQHRLTELVQQAGKARQEGNRQKAEKLLAQARAIDPENPIVIEHSGPDLAKTASAAQAPDAASGHIASDQASGKPGDKAGGALPGPLADRARLLSGGEEREPWSIQAPELEGAIHLAPSDAVKSFHLNGLSPDLLRDVASAYGIRAIVDDSVERKNINFDLENVNYQQAMDVLMEMAHVIAVPVDETSVLVAHDLPSNRLLMERLVEETIYLPGSTQEQINDMANVARNIFGVRQATAQVATGSIVVRAPQEVLATMNRVLEDLMDATGEVMIEVKMYEVDTSRMANTGANIPTAAGIYNVDQAATALVNANQTLVQQAIAQGLGNPPITATSSELTIAGELIASGLVQSSLFNSTIGVIGGGTMMTGITETGNISFNLGLNSSDTRTLDDVQMRVADRQTANFREGTRYPITSSTYSSGLSTAASALSNKTINGVNVASLLSQYAGGSSMTIPQVTYEDLGVTLNATPVILKSGQINMKLDLKIESLTGSTSDGNPILGNREFKSDITVMEGESVLMVSYVSKTESAAMSGIPGLSELPGFQLPVTQDIQKDTNQLVMVVTPHVVRRRSDMVASPRIAYRGQAAN